MLNYASDMKVAGVRLISACYLAVVCVNMQWLAGLNSTLLTNKYWKQACAASWGCIWPVSVKDVKTQDGSVLLSLLCFSGVRLQLQICLPLGSERTLSVQSVAFGSIYQTCRAKSVTFTRAVQSASLPQVSHPLNDTSRLCGVSSWGYSESWRSFFSSSASA